MITGILLLLTSLILLISIIGILLFIDFKLTIISMSVFGLLYVSVILIFRKTLLKNSEIISQNQTLMVKKFTRGCRLNKRYYIRFKNSCKIFFKINFERGFKVAVNDLIAQSPRFLLETVGIILISIFLFSLVTLK